MNNTLTTVATSTSPDTHALLILVVMFATVVGFLFGVLSARPTVTQARIQHKALLLLNQQNHDPIVAGLIHRQINRLERRLHIHDDDSDS